MHQLSPPSEKPLDIFKMDTPNYVRWLEPAADLKSAKTRLKVLGAAMPGKYVVFSRKNRERIMFAVGEDGRLKQLKK
jgi:hypothetical protein